MTTETSIDVMAELGILEPHEVAQLLKLRHSTVLDLSRRGVLPAFKIGKHWRYRRADLEEWMCAGATPRSLGAHVTGEGWLFRGRDELVAPRLKPDQIRTVRRAPRHRHRVAVEALQVSREHRVIDLVQESSSDVHDPSGSMPSRFRSCARWCGSRTTLGRVRRVRTALKKRLRADRPFQGVRGIGP